MVKAADLAEGLAEQVERGCEARADVARKQSLPIVCAVGCNGCCEELVLVYQPEAIAVTRWLMRPENQAVRDAFLAAYPAWKAATGSVPVTSSAGSAKWMTNTPSARMSARAISPLRTAAKPTPMRMKIGPVMPRMVSKMISDGERRAWILFVASVSINRLKRQHCLPWANNPAPAKACRTIPPASPRKPAPATRGGGFAGRAR